MMLWMALFPRQLGFVESHMAPTLSHTHTNARAHAQTPTHVLTASRTAHTSHGTAHRGRSAGATPRHTRRGQPAPTAAAVHRLRQECGAQACPRQPLRPVPHTHSTYPPTILHTSPPGGPSHVPPATRARARFKPLISHVHTPVSHALRAHAPASLVISP